MRPLTIVCLAALLGCAGTAPVHAQSTANQADKTPSASNSSPVNNAEDESTQSSHIKVMWAHLLDNPPPKVTHEEASPDHPIPLAEAVKEYTEITPKPHRKGDFTFQFGNFPYFPFYEWVPPIGNQPIPYGLNYW